MVLFSNGVRLITITTVRARPSRKTIKTDLCDVVKSYSRRRIGNSHAPTKHTRPDLARRVRSPVARNLARSPPTRADRADRRRRRLRTLNSRRTIIIMTTTTGRKALAPVRVRPRRGFDLERRGPSRSTICGRVERVSRGRRRPCH